MADPAIDLKWHAAPRDLEGLVSGFAERRDAAKGGGARELPLASPLLQVFLSGEYRVDGLPVPGSGLWGPCSRTRHGEAERTLHVFVVILTLRGASALAAAPVRALVERTLDLADLRPDWRDLPGMLTEAADFTARVRIMETRLRVALGAARTSPTLRLADAVAGHRMQGSVGALNDAAGLGVRGLQKRFEHEIGWSPKRLLRIARLQRVLRTLHPRSWSAPAGDALLEFTDEAHLARDFRQLTGLSPSAFVRAKRQSGDPLLHTVLSG